MLKEAFIIDSIRTARAVAEEAGSLSSVKPLNLLLPLISKIISTHHLPTTAIDSLILGCIAQSAEQGDQLAYALSLKSTLSAACSSAMISNGKSSAYEALSYSLTKIATGLSEVGIAAGVLSQSRQNERTYENMLLDDPSLFFDHQMISSALAADSLATMRGFTRRDLDQYALHSHQKAGYAYEKGFNKNSLLTIRDPLDSPLLSYDELVKENITMEDLAKFSPSNQGLDSQSGERLKASQLYNLPEEIRAIHHSGNSASLADGAGAVLVASLAATKKFGLVPRAKIRAVASGYSDQDFPFGAQTRSIESALENAKLSIEDIDLFEIDESFAAWPLNFIDHFKVDSDRVNVNGGSIATGEVIGMSAIFQLTSILDELERRQRRLGLVTIHGNFEQAQCFIIESLGERS